MKNNSWKYPEGKILMRLSLRLCNAWTIPTIPKSKKGKMGFVDFAIPVFLW